MAILYPSVISPDAPSSERKVWDASAKLDDSWRIFHSVAWQSRRNGRQGDGEADFLVLHPNYGILVLEVKGGRVEVANGEWYTVDRHDTRHRIKNPFAQAKDSKYALLRYLDEMEPPLDKIPPVCHAVVFPDIGVDTGIGLDGPRAIVCDRADLSDMEITAKRIFAHWECKVSLSASDVKRITAKLAPTVTIRIRLADVVAESKEKLLELTAQQVRAFAGLRRNRKMLVIGGAGTGKTVLAMERARWLADEGHRTLLTCYNAPLAASIAEQFKGDDKVTVAHFHALCLREIRAAGLSVPADPDRTWWEQTACDTLLEAAASNGTVFDAVVVDEGQDFAPEWLVALSMLTHEPDCAPFYVFADSHQELYPRDWALPDKWPEYTLDINCRNTLPIAAKVAAVYGEEASSFGVPGKEPVFVDAKGKRECFKLAQKIVTRLLEEEGLDPRQIVVLADSRELVDTLRTMSVGEYVFCAIGGFGVVAETVYRFKGLEADAVVLVLAGDDDGEAVARACAYVGMSRARILLFVIGERNTQAITHID